MQDDGPNDGFETERLCMSLIVKAQNFTTPESPWEEQGKQIFFATNYVKQTLPILLMLKAFPTIAAAEGALKVLALQGIQPYKVATGDANTS